jgi:hypothetical protein
MWSCDQLVLFVCFEINDTRARIKQKTLSYDWGNGHIIKRGARLRHFGTQSVAPTPSFTHH